MISKDKAFELFFGAVGVVLFILFYIGMKIVLKISIMEWLQSHGIPPWVAILAGFAIVAVLFTGLGHLFSKNEKKMEDWLDNMEAKEAQKKAEKKARKAAKKASQSNDDESHKS